MKNPALRSGKVCLWALVGILMVGLIICRPGLALASEKAEAQSIVDKSKGVLTDLMSDEHYTWLHTYLKTAKGVVIFPQILKAGFFLGGSGGTGVLLVRNEATGTWSDPAFYTLGSVTFGLQFGGEAAEVVMVALDQKAIDSLLSSSVKLGGDVSIAIGPIGGGAKGSVTIPEVRADFVSFAKTKGLYGGLNFEGSVMEVRDALNSAYFGKKVTPKDILTRKAVDKSGASELRSALEKASTK
jgi:lipid-binding SYLF domain-containing protein